MLNKLERCHSRYSISHTTRQILKKKCLNVEYDIRPIRQQEYPLFRDWFSVVGWV